LNQRGFTLIELLMAITMLALIIGVMGGALSLAHRTTEKGEKKIEALERKKIVFSLVESQIQSTFASFYTEQGEKKNRFAGAKDTMTFASNYSIWRGTRGNCLVKYQIETDDRRKCIIRIEEQVLGTDEKQATRVATDYDAIRFEYFLKTALDEGKWVEEWPAEEKSMPPKIRILFSDGKNDRVLTARVFTQTASPTVGVTSMPIVTK
jgi:general secretion pathway protein J